MSKRTLSYEDDLLERLQDEDYAVLYLNAALEDDETDDSASSVAVFLLALRDVAKAHKVANVAQSAGVSRESLYKALSETGNPSLTNLKAVLKALGLRLAITRRAEEAKSGELPQAEYRGPYSTTNLYGEGVCPISPTIKKIMAEQPFSIRCGTQTFEPNLPHQPLEDADVEAPAA